MMQLLHFLAFSVGTYILYLTYAMRESTEGKWVNRIEELWVRIDDRNKAVGDTTKALFGAVAEKVTKALNRIVGAKIISLRLVGISGSLSFASLLFFIGFFFELASYFLVTYSDKLKQVTPNADKMESALPLFIVAGIVSLIVSLLFVASAILPIVFKSSIWSWVSCIPTTLYLLIFFRMVYLHLADAKQFGFASAVAMSLASDILLLIIVRESLKWMMARTTLLRATATITIHSILMWTLFFLPFHFAQSGGVARAKSTLGMTFGLLGFFNIPTGLASAAFVCLLLMVLLHRLAWPFLSQWTYVLTRKDVLEKRKIARGIAILLIGFGLSGLPRSPLVLKVIETLFK
jgi:hypothetical protein